jgi:hypothetical protein
LALLHIRRPSAVVLCVAGLLAWLVVDGPLRSGLDIETVRVPVLIMLVCIAAATVRVLDADQREVVLQGVIVLGTVQASIAVTESTRVFASKAPSMIGRADALIGNPNALGVLLVASGALTTRHLLRRPSVGLSVALAVQAVALLLTGSRLALTTAVCIVVGYSLARTSWSARLLLTIAAAPAVAIAGLRFLNSWPDQRIPLWGSAIRRFLESPFIGHGPTPRVYDVALAHPWPTTNAHDELLQWGVDYGLVGVALAAATLAAVAVRWHRGLTRDGWLFAALGGVLATGVTDVGLRVTAITLLGAVVAGVAALPSPDAPGHANWARCSRPGGDERPGARTQRGAVLHEGHSDVVPHFLVALGQSPLNHPQQLPEGVEITTLEAVNGEPHQVGNDQVKQDLVVRDRKGSVDNSDRLRVPGFVRPTGTMARPFSSSPTVGSIAAACRAALALDLFSSRRESGRSSSPGPCRSRLKQRGGLRGHLPVG